MSDCAQPGCGNKVGYVLENGTKQYDRLCEKHDLIEQVRIAREAEENGS